MAQNEIAHFEKWLKEKYELLEGEIYDLEVPESVLYRTADLVREASDMARRLGAGHLAVSKFESYQGGEVCGLHDAKSVIGRMLHWCREQAARTGGLDNGSDEGPFSVEQVAQRLRVSDDTVYSWINSGKLKATNIAKAGAQRPRYRITREAVDGFLRSKQEQAPKRQTKRARKPPKEYH